MKWSKRVDSTIANALLIFGVLYVLHGCVFGLSVPDADAQSVHVSEKTTGDGLPPTEFNYKGREG